MKTRDVCLGPSPRPRCCKASRRLLSDATPASRETANRGPVLPPPPWRFLDDDAPLVYPYSVPYPLPCIPTLCTSSLEPWDIALRLASKANKPAHSQTRHLFMPCDQSITCLSTWVMTSWPSWWSHRSLSTRPIAEPRGRYCRNDLGNQSSYITETLIPFGVSGSNGEKDNNGFLSGGMMLGSARALSVTLSSSRMCSAYAGRGAWERDSQLFPKAN